MQLVYYEVPLVQCTHVLQPITLSKIRQLFVNITTIVHSSETRRKFYICMYAILISSRKIFLTANTVLEFSDNNCDFHYVNRCVSSL